MAHNLEQTCMVVNLQIGTWLGYKHDKQASAEVVERNNAKEGTARVNKHIVPRESLAAVVTAANAVRTHFYNKTLPWKDNGDRLLTRDLMQIFIAEHGRLIGKFRDQVDDFLEVKYPQVLAQAEFRMGDLFNADDYPTAPSLAPKFYANLDTDALTLPDSLKGILQDKATEAEIVAGAETALAQRLNRAMTDVWSRLATTLGHFAAKMGGDEIFRDSTVNNLNEIVDLLPALNILNDPNLERINRDIKDTIAGFDAKTLRKDTLQRREAAAKAQEIMADMAGYMNAFSGVN